MQKETDSVDGQLMAKHDVIAHHDLACNTPMM
jgi:hypothetical protein